MNLTEGTKYDDDKIPLDLLSPYFLSGTAEVLRFGAEKYESYNWAKGIKYSRVFSALQRHLWAFWAGENLDQETGLPHLWHANCCLMFLTHYEAADDLYKEFDDKPNYSSFAGAARTRDSEKELSRTRRFSGEDPESVVTPQSLNAHPVQGAIHDWEMEGDLT